MNLSSQSLSKQAFAYARVSSPAGSVNRTALVKQMAKLLSIGVDSNNILLGLELKKSSVRPAFTS